MKVPFTLHITPTIFKVIFIFWSLYWGIFAGTIVVTNVLIYDLVAELGTLPFQRVHVFFICQFFCGLLMPLNLILFYVSLVHLRKNYSSVFKLTGIVALILFLGLEYRIRDILTTQDFIHLTILVVLHIIVLLRHTDYIIYLRSTDVRVR